VKTDWTLQLEFGPDELSITVVTLITGLILIILIAAFKSPLKRLHDGMQDAGLAFEEGIVRFFTALATCKSQVQEAGGLEWERC